ncbi:ATP-binding cassette domain-containing protein [Moorena producens]|uniref:ATP-binding cassette domain-containing protein n=1 Tax=Moorena producens TaxID=1155739 RepID=UPI003C75FE9F
MSYLELNNQGQVLRFSLEKGFYRLGRDRTWSDFDIPEKGWTIVSQRHAFLLQEGEDYRIFDGDGANPSTNGLFVNHTRITDGYLLKHGVELTIGQNPRDYIRLSYFNPAHSQPKVTRNKRQLSLASVQKWPLQLGRSPNPELSHCWQLDAPTVSTLHATIIKISEGNYQINNYSRNGTFINDKLIHKPVLLKDGNTIRIGPFILLLRQDTLELVDQGNQIRIDADKLLRQVSYKLGKKRTILNQVSMPIEPGQLVALVGGSGTGKSTLLKTLLGIAPITKGTVFINGQDLRQHFNQYRSQIGYVPQDDIVHRDLTVKEVLTYACQLRLPPDTDVKQVVKQTLSQVKLDFVRNTVVGNLSGGQRKRVSIAVELLADPKLFFLDEPTSGLDPGLDKEMMQLLRELANQGRTVVLVTHATANIDVCDRIAFMGRGGRLCYFGPPTEAMDFFKMPSPDLRYFPDIYLKLEQGETPEELEQNSENWHQRFLSSPGYKTYISAHLSPGQRLLSTSIPSKSAGIPVFKQLKQLKLKQLLLLSRRYLKLVVRDMRSVALALLTAPIGISLIILTLSGKDPLAQLNSPEITQAPLALQVLFIFTCAALWVGLSSSLQEIVKESSIYARERLVNLGLFPYLGSKVLIRCGLALLQTILIVTIVLYGFKSPTSALLDWKIGLGITTFLTIIAATSLGLMVSTLVKNESEANNTIPLILLPQIIFSGVIFKLKGLASTLSWLMVSRWSMGAYGALVNVNSMVPEQSSRFGLKLPPPPFEATPVYDATWQNLILNWLLLCLHIAVYLIIAFRLQKRKDIF